LLAPNEKYVSMNRANILMGFYCVLLMCISCNNFPYEDTLRKAEAMLELAPDSTLILLNTIPHPENLRKKGYYQYYLTRLQVKDKKNLDISEDTLIFIIKDYFIKKKDFQKAALAAFYSGQVLKAQKEYEKAMEACLEAENLSMKISDIDNLKGLIQGSLGEIYYQQLLKDKAIVRYKQASNYFRIAKNYKNESITYNLIGNCSFILGEYDSAFVYYNKGIELADKHNLLNEQAGIRQSFGVAYRETGDLDLAKIYFKEALFYPVDSLEKARIYYNLASVFNEDNQSDSAQYYINTSLNFMPGGKDNFLSAAIYRTWSVIEEKQNNYPQALSLHKMYSKYLASILNENKNKAVLELQSKYDFQRIQNKSDQYRIEKQRIFLLASFLFLSIIVLLFIFYFLSMQNKKMGFEAEKRIYQLKEMARTFNDKEDSFRAVLLEHFGILKKVALLEGYLGDEKKKQGEYLLRTFNKTVYGQDKMDWNKFYQVMNDLYGGFFYKLQTEFSELDESEFRISCLTYADFSNTEIAIITGYSVNTVQMKKTGIRKKLNIKTLGNIKDFLEKRVIKQS